MDVISDHHQERWKRLCHTDYSNGALEQRLEVGQKRNAKELLPTSNNALHLK